MLRVWLYTCAGCILLGGGGTDDVNRNGTLCGDGARRRRGMQVKLRFRTTLRRSCMSKARNAGKVAFFVCIEGCLRTWLMFIFLWHGKNIRLEVWILTFCSLVENARFGRLRFQFFGKSRGKRSFWKCGCVNFSGLAVLVAVASCWKLICFWAPIGAVARELTYSQFCGSVAPAPTLVWLFSCIAVLWVFVSTCCCYIGKKRNWTRKETHTTW